MSSSPSPIVLSSFPVQLIKASVNSVHAARVTESKCYLCFLFCYREMILLWPSRSLINLTFSLTSFQGMNLNLQSGRWGWKRICACVFSLYVCNLDLINPEGTWSVCPWWWWCSIAQIWLTITLWCYRGQWKLMRGRKSFFPWFKTCANRSAQFEM